MLTHPSIEATPAPMETHPVNNPNPTRRQLRAEAAADRLLGEQAAAAATFHALIKTALDGINRLDFPLGSPTLEYDLDEVTGSLAAWLTPQETQFLEEMAEDAALEREAA